MFSRLRDRKILSSFEKIRLRSKTTFSIDPDISIARTPPGSFYRPSDETTFTSQCIKIFKDPSTWLYAPETLLARNKGDAVPFSTLPSSHYSEPLVAVKDMNEYQQFAVEKLSVIEGISNVQSTFVLEEIKNEVAHKLQ
jgi:hypothetical protein